MYYLVVVSVAYLPTLAGIILNLNFFINQANSSNISKGNIFQLILFGVITSSSWEMGTVYQLFFSSCLFLLLLLSIFSTKFNYLAFSRLTKSDRWKLSIANLIPFAFSLYILFLLQASRLTIVEDSSVASPLARDFNASFIATILQFFKELFFGGGNNISFYDFTYSLIYKLGFLLLLMIFFYQAKIKFNFLTINACLISIVPLLITNFVITFSGYYQLGINSYPRQISFKVALIGLTIVIIALMLASLCSSLSNQLNIKNININALMSSPLTLLISFCLTFTLLINFQFDNLKRDLLNFNNILISNHQNWQRNLHSSQSLAVYTQVPSHYIFRMSFEPGLYPACDHPDNGRPVRYMNYFHKQKLYVTPFSNKAFSDEEIEEQLVRVSQEMKNRKNKIDFACSFTPGNAKLVLGNVEQINQLTSLDQIIEVNIDDTVEIYGWAMNPDNSPPEKIIITLENNENLLVDQTLDIPRPDIAKHFGNPSLLNSGWKATFSPKPEWNGQTLTFIVWAYNPDTKIANFAKDFTIRFSSSKQN